MMNVSVGSNVMVVTCCRCICPVLMNLPDATYLTTNTLVLGSASCFTDWHDSSREATNRVPYIPPKSSTSHSLFLQQ